MALSAHALGAPMTPLEAVRVWIARFRAVPSHHWFRSPAEHDLRDADGFWFPAEAVAAIDTGQPFVPVFTNVILFRGADMRAFAPVWNQIVAQLGIGRVPPGASAAQKQAALQRAANPVSQDADSITSALSKLTRAEAELSGKSRVPWVTLAVTTIALTGALAFGVRDR